MDKLPTTVTTSLGKILHLTRQLGKGGEGAVFEIREQTDVAAKLYWPKNAAVRKDKVSAMATAGWAKMNPIVAFPIDVLFDSNGTFAGYVMKKIGGHKPIHMLYSPASRKAEFQKAQFPFLVRAAQNIARAVASVHTTGCVIGDVNHSGFLVSEAATSVLIDSDSFQVLAANKNFFCQVGTPEYTPAEMQGGKFDRVKRTPNHDNFGLSVLIFQLLFLGKHPFAGRYSGSGDMPLERAIGEFRFAYSTSPNGMRPPPGAPLLADFPNDVAGFFERAFGKVGISQRPAAAEWVVALQKLEGLLQPCSSDKNHHHVKDKPCPWCRMEDQNPGFVAFSSTLNIAIDPAKVDIQGLLAIIRGVPDPGPPPNIHSTVPPPTNLTPTQSTTEIQAQIKIRAAIANGAAALGTLLVYIGGSAVLPGWILIAAGVASGFIDSAGLKTARQNRVRAEAGWRNIQETWNNLTGNQKYLLNRTEAEGLVKSLSDLPAEQQRSLAELERKKRDLQLNRFLDRFKIADAKIRKVGSGRKALLASYGIETAADVSFSSVQAIQGFGGSLAANLVAWRDGLAARFVFNPSEPLNPQDVNALKMRLAQKRQDLEKKLRISATSLKQASLTATDQRRKLAQAAEHTLRGLRQAELDEKIATGPIYQASRIGPFMLAGVAAFILSQSLPTNTNASARTEVGKSPENAAVTTPVFPTVPIPPIRRDQPPLRNNQSPPVTSNAGNKKIAEAGRTADTSKTPSAFPAVPMPAYPSTSQGLQLSPPPQTNAAPPLPEGMTITSLSNPVDRSERSLTPPPDATDSTPLNPLRSSDASKIQERLIFWGFLSGVPDGKWGSGSKRALQEFRIRNGINSTDAWDVQSQKLLFDRGAQILRPVPVAFVGSWTDERGVCGEPGSAPPLKLMPQSAVTPAGDSCTFAQIQSDGNNSWRMTAKCKVSGQTRQSNVRLSLNGSELNWSSENGSTTYYRCE